MSFHDLSYRKHAEHFQGELRDEKRIARSEAWFDRTTTDFWRHNRMYEAVNCFTSDLDGTWLTIGDGRFGLDAVRLAERGFRNVLPSDISDALLKKSKQQGRIARYSIENAERLSFEEEQFDYVLCKESYHHFPRPALALYEMLRVARKAVVLVEPNDTFQLPFRRLKHLIKTLLRGKSHIDECFYEESGNYIYSITRREMEKVALGINLPLIATKGLNDHYIEGCEFEPASWRSPLYRRIRAKCAVKNVISRLRLHDYSMLMVVFFKDDPGESILAQFRCTGWNVVRLPRNPYIQEPERNCVKSSTV
jgi:SAM-dependent methyltransferase